MSYRLEQNKESGENELVIDGWDKGISDSPYLGISSIKNMNCSWLPQAAYVNYKRKPATISGGTMAVPKYYAAATGTSTGYYFILDSNSQVWEITNGGNTATLITGNTTGAGGYGIAYWQNYLFVWGTKSGVDFVDVCGDGTGVGGITSGNWANINSSNHYLTSLTSVSMTTGITAGQTTITLSSSWAYVSGNYEVKLTLSSGIQYVIGTFTHGSTTVTISPAANDNGAATTIDVNIFPKVAQPSAPYEHMALVGYDDVLYFANGVTVGSILAPTGQFFSKTGFSTSKFNYNAVQIPLTDIANWLVNFSDSLYIGGNLAVYPWGAFKSPQPTRYDIPLPIVENVSKMINILNNVYIFAGSKGNIYYTNGYSITLFKKIPDSFLGTIDPNWDIGGVMFHRNKLFFGGLGVSNNGSTKIMGIFSLSLVGGSTSYSFESAGALDYESQNSFGFTPTATNDATNVLIDGNSAVLSTSSSQPDNYLSAWYNNSVGGVDYNDTTPWGNFEPAIETDLIPIGSILTGATLAQIEFKLDRPMVSGDQIRISYRTSFTDSYTLMGTTTTAVLSDIYPTGINAAQWVQFKVEFKCASSGSSFIPLREMRLHYGN